MAPSFPPGSLVQRVNAEPAIALGAGRALLLQLAHPAVAAGVQDHSDFKRNPFKRLQGTLEAMYGVVFGSDELADGIGRRVRWIHDFVTGPAYAANDPVNLLWVHTTLVDTAMSCFERFLRPLTDEEREVYYQEMAQVAERFGCALTDQPPTYAAFRAYFDGAVAAMEVSDAGRDLGAFILDPVLPLRLDVPLTPLLRFQRLLTVGMLPASLRAQFGFPWTAADDVRFDRAVRRLRAVFRATPRPIRVSGTRLQGVYLVWLAKRHIRQFDEKMAAVSERAVPG
jgi:uncharacterized protein (DUF2236 family)